MSSPRATAGKIVHPTTEQMAVRLADLLYVIPKSVETAALLELATDLAMDLQERIQGRAR